MYKKLNLKEIKTGSLLSIYKASRNLNNLTEYIWIHEDSKELFNATNHVSEQLAKASINDMIMDENNQEIYLVLSCTQA